MSKNFDFLLGEPGDEGADYRHQNLGDEIEREVVIDRGEDLFIGCELLPVIHGHYGKSAASLVIFDFSFLPNKRAKRFVKAEVTVLFADEQDYGVQYDPEVKEISFMPSGRGGYYSLFPTTTKQEVKRSSNLSGSGGAFGVSLTGGYTYEVSETVEKHNAAILASSKRVRGRPNGRQNSAEWTLIENSSTKDGIPTFMRAAVLLLRPELTKGRRFKATVTMNVKLDVLTAVEEGIKDLFGKRKIPPVDPVIFDPDRKDSPDPIINIDPKNITAQTLQEISVVLSRNILSDAKETANSAQGKDNGKSDETETK